MSWHMNLETRIWSPHAGRVQIPTYPIPSSPPIAGGFNTGKNWRALIGPSTNPNSRLSRYMSLNSPTVWKQVPIPKSDSRHLCAFQVLSQTLAIGDCKGAKRNTAASTRKAIDEKTPDHASPHPNALTTLPSSPHCSPSRSHLLACVATHQGAAASRRRHATGIENSPPIASLSNRTRQDAVR